MLLADGNGGYALEMPTASPTGEILDGISTQSATIATPTPTLTATPVKTGSSWLTWALIALVVVVGGYLIVKKVFKL